MKRREEVSVAGKGGMFLLASIFTMRSIRHACFFITPVRVYPSPREIGKSGFCVSGLRRFSEFSVERLVGRVFPVSGKITFVGGLALHEGWRPAPDPFRHANFVRIAPSSPRYEFHRSLSRLSPSNAYASRPSI